jgi:hypothetical protein
LSDEELDGVAGGLAQTAEGGLKAFKLKFTPGSPLEPATLSYLASSKTSE